MKSVYNHLKEPIAHYLKKDILKEGIKTMDVFTQKMKGLEVEDKVNISLNKELYERQISTYKPYARSIMKEHTSLVSSPKSNFSNLVRNSSYFYGSTTGMDKSIDVTSDYVFKGIFSDPDRAKNFLESILIGNNKILPEDTKIENLQYLKTEYIQNKLPQSAKKTIFDLQIKTNNGIFIIEMQKNVSQDYLKRVEFYNAVAYSQQQIKGDGSVPMKDYTKALPIITISVIDKPLKTDKRLFDDNVPCVSYHVNIEKETQKQYMCAFSYVFIELDKFDENNYNKLTISDDERDWLSFMKEQNLTQSYKNEQVNSAVKYIDNIRTNKYEEYVRFQMSEVAVQKEVESAKDEGINIGENKKAFEMAAKMLIKKKPIEEIIEFTGLSKEQIDDIK